MNAPQLHTPVTLDHWIGGAAVPPAGGQYFDDLNPLDDSVYARAADGNAADVERAVQAAAQAFPAFRKLLAKDREALLQRPPRCWSATARISSISSSTRSARQ